MSKVKLALLGAGEVAQNFHLPILSGLANVELSVLGNRTIRKARTLADKYGIAKAVSSVEEIAEDNNVQAVVLSTPTNVHYEQAKILIQSGKHLLIEKPVVSNSREAVSLAELADEHKVKVMVGMNHRFRSDAKMLKNYSANGNLGDLYFIKSGWSQKKEGLKWQEKIERTGGKGVLTELGLSLIDSILWIMDFKEVASVRATNFHRISDAYEDISVARIDFKDGSVATIDTSWAIYSGETNYYCNVYGNTGSARVNPFQLNTSGGDIMKENQSGHLKTNYSLHKKSYASELKHFIYTVQGHLPLMSNLKEASVSLKILEGLYTSAETGREVVIIY
ncbi:MAG: Gfo/Idh/MocA family oxidoreductase [Candidatus Kapaibacteriales bacterium]